MSFYLLISQKSNLDVDLVQRTMFTWVSPNILNTDILSKPIRVNSIVTSCKNPKSKYSKLMEYDAEISKPPFTSEPGYDGWSIHS